MKLVQKPTMTVAVVLTEIVVLAAGVMVILIEAMIVTAVMIVVKIDRLLKLLKLLTWVHKTSICQQRYLLKRLQKSRQRKSKLEINQKIEEVPHGTSLFFMQFNPYLREDSLFLNEDHREVYCKLLCLKKCQEILLLDLSPYHLIFPVCKLLKLTMEFEIVI